MTENLTEFYPVHVPFNDNGELRCATDGEPWPCPEALAAGEPAPAAPEAAGSTETAPEAEAAPEATPEAEAEPAPEPDAGAGS